MQTQTQNLNSSSQNLHERLVDIDLNLLYDEFNINYYDLMKILMNKMEFAVVGVSTDTGNIQIDFASNDWLHEVANKFIDLLEELYKRYNEISQEEFDNRIREFAVKHGVVMYRVIEYDVAYFIVPEQENEG